MDTPVTRLLQQQDISYRILIHTKAALTVEDAAEARGVAASAMIKCLVFFPRKGPRLIVACLPGSARLSMSKLKVATGVKEFRSSTPDAVAQAVGFPVGAIPPVALPEDAVVLVHAGILRTTVVNISTGDPNAGLELRVHDLRRILRCTFADLVE
jgi:Ala-tRNA(Pro) deacylase